RLPTYPASFVLTPREEHASGQRPRTPVRAHGIALLLASVHADARVTPLPVEDVELQVEHRVAPVAEEPLLDRVRGHALEGLHPRVLRVPAAPQSLPDEVRR